MEKGVAATRLCRINLIDGLKFTSSADLKFVQPCVELPPSPQFIGRRKAIDQPCRVCEDIPFDDFMPIGRISKGQAKIACILLGLLQTVIGWSTFGLGFDNRNRKTLGIAEQIVDALGFRPFGAVAAQHDLARRVLPVGLVEMFAPDLAACPT